MVTTTNEREVYPDTAVDGPGVPVAVHPDADLGTRGSSTPNFSDSIYINGELSAGDRRFGVLVHILWHGNENRFESVSVVDQAAGWYRTSQVKLPADRLSWAPRSLDITTPQVRWVGNSQHQTLTVNSPTCELDLVLDAQGPVLYYGGTGTYSLLGEQQWQYALPQLRTTGTLTIEGRAHHVAGDLWLDRQSGLHPNLAHGTWTWMNISLGNGDKIGIWSARNATTQESWATLLHPDGTEELVPVKPLPDSVERVWTSPVSGQSFPTRWAVEIPSRQTTMTVTATPQDQEIVGPLAAIYEGIGAVTGTYLGRPVTGTTYVEMVGNWTNRHRREHETDPSACRPVPSSKGPAAPRFRGAAARPARASAPPRRWFR